LTIYQIDYPKIPFSILAIFIVFRNNSSYGRLVGGMHNFVKLSIVLALSHAKLIACTENSLAIGKLMRIKSKHLEGINFIFLVKMRKISD
jgi:hypothetical protein